MDNKPVVTFKGQGSSGNNLEKPMGIVCNADQNLLVINGSSLKIQTLNQFGEILDTREETANGIGLTKNGGDIITISQADKMVRVNYKTHTQELTRDEFKCPVAVATDRKGRVYVADRDAGAVFVFNVKGVFIGQIGSKGKRLGQLQRPVHVTVNDQNEVAVCDVSQNFIQWYDAAGQPLRKFAFCWNADQLFDTPCELCIDHQGRMVMLDKKRSNGKYASKIKRFTSEEKLISEIDGGEGSNWESITLSSDGHVFVTDYDKHVIHKYKYSYDMSTPQPYRDLEVNKVSTPLPDRDSVSH